MTDAMLDFDLGEMADAIRETTRRFAKDKIEPIAAEIDATDEFPRHLWPQMGELGLHGITVEEEDGGLGLGYVEHVVAQEEVARFREGQAVKLVFRPEDVCVSRTGILPESCRRLTNGVIEEISFVGAYERLTIRLDLIARQPTEGAPPLYNVTINTPDKRMGIPIIVTRPKPEAAATRLNLGDRVAVGLTSFRVLPNFTLTSERAGRIVETKR